MKRGHSPRRKRLRAGRRRSGERAVVENGFARVLGRGRLRAGLGRFILALLGSQSGLWGVELWARLLEVCESYGAEGVFVEVVGGCGGGGEGGVAVAGPTPAVVEGIKDPANGVAARDG